VKLFPVHRGKMATQFGDKKYGIPNTTLQYWPSKRFSAVIVERIADLGMYSTLHSNSNLRENSINLQEMFYWIFGVEFGQHSFELPE